MTPAIRDHLSQALADLRASHAAQARAIAALETSFEVSLQQDLNALPELTAPVSEHRRAHRPGCAPKIAADAELQTFILARIDRLTFAEIASQVADHFPASRHVSKTTIWEWWRKQQEADRRPRG